jgi:hypothetical protein
MDDGLSFKESLEKVLVEVELDSKIKGKYTGAEKKGIVQDGSFYSTEELRAEK